MHTFCVAAFTKIIYTLVTGRSYSMIVDTTAVVRQLLTLTEGRDKESQETNHN